jgi:hypothetical protein
VAGEQLLNAVKAPVGDLDLGVAGDQSLLKRGTPGRGEVLRKHERDRLR